MNHPEEAPKLSKLPFIAGDLVLIATAVVIALRSAAPITPGPLLAITICVVAGSALLVIPFLANYARRQDAELTERQNQIAALARITSDSAEQLSIVASGLNGIAESSKHNLSSIEKLPAKLQERIDGLTQQLAGSALSAHSSVKEDVTRLEATAEKISRTLAKHETASKTKSDTLAGIEKDLAAALARATAQLESFAFATTLSVEKITRAPAPAPAEKPARTKSSRPPSPAPTETAPVTEPETVTEEPATIAPVVVHEIPAEPAPPALEPVVEPTPAMVTAVEETPAQPASITETPSVVVEPPTEEVFTPSEPEAAEVPVSEPEAPKAPRARKPRDDDSGFDLGLTPEAPEATESAITSDGFTRLIATAYIGIGNKLFIRGEGPGLSWDKGVPLQFVSIGKWRWETPDATAPIKAKLYKNDQVECLGLSSLTLEPGRQHEVNAGF
ncbi:hypothetical protein [Rariglobus hedericola]|uniref:Uncharacterized protein n=1 Tax=Rariglobus hedericola TaxID=2597822 RepID=A0A556QS62_9BACT|nr:hypothetical protein [Rariglobus hedericola]TSJ79478.1 hypothetical protein FPL22_09375 [Rariglobus hedericola]